MSRLGYAIMSVVCLVITWQLMAFQPARAQDGEKKKPPVKHAASLEDALKRAGSRARKSGETILRITASPSLTADEDNYVVVVEFAAGTVGLFQGYVDPADDQYVLVEKREVDLVFEATERSKRR